MNKHDNEKFLAWLEDAKMVLPAHWSIAKTREFYRDEFLNKNEDSEKEVSDE